MKRKAQKGLAMLKSVIALKTAYRDLEDRDDGIPGMMLVTGVSGSGKTTAAEFLCKELGGIWLRALATDTPVAMLTRLIRACGQQPNSTRGNSPMVEQIANFLHDNELPLFVDEADFLLGSKKLIESLRDIHDLSDMPIVMIGHAGLEKRFNILPQISRRISQWISIPPADFDDAVILATHVCSTRVEEDLLQQLHRECRGGIGLMVVGLSRIQSVAETNNLKRIDLETWGSRRKFFVNQLSRTA